MDAPHDNLIRQVKRLAKKRGLSMNRLADAAGVARVGVAAWFEFGGPQTKPRQG